VIRSARLGDFGWMIAGQDDGCYMRHQSFIHEP